MHKQIEWQEVKSVSLLAYCQPAAVIHLVKCCDVVLLQVLLHPQQALH